MLLLLGACTKNPMEEARSMVESRSDFQSMRFIASSEAVALSSVNGKTKETKVSLVEVAYATKEGRIKKIRFDAQKKPLKIISIKEH